MMSPAVPDYGRAGRSLSTAGRIMGTRWLERRPGVDRGQISCTNAIEVVAIRAGAGQA